MQAGIERMNRQLAERTDYDSEDYQAKLTASHEADVFGDGRHLRAE